MESALLSVVCSFSAGHQHSLKVGIDDEWHPHLFMVVYEFQNIFAFLWHDCSLWLLTNALTVIGGMGADDDRQCYSYSSVWVGPLSRRSVS